MKQENIRFGVSSFCYSTEIYHGKMSLTDCLRATKEAGAEGFEIVGSHHIPGFPTPSKEWLYDFRRACDEIGVRTHCYATHVDRGRRSDRQLTDDEMLQSTIKDLEYARILGAECIRSQYILRPRMMERILPWAERLDVKVGIEMHPPHRLDRPVWIEFMEEFRRLDSPYVGIIPDFGCFQDTPPRNWEKPYLEIGVTPECVDMLMTGHREKRGKAELEEELKRLGGNQFAFKMLSELYEWYQPCDEATFRDYKEALPYSVELHGKFFNIENGNEALLPYRRLLSIAQECNYQGYLTSEWEGFFLNDHMDAVQQVKDHIQMERALLGYEP